MRDLIVGAFYASVGVVFVGTLVVLAIAGIASAFGIAGPTTGPVNESPPVIGPLVGLLAWALYLSLLLVARRSAVHVTPEGIRLVPWFGRARDYGWAEIAGFSVATFTAYSNWPYAPWRWNGVVMKLESGSTILLRPTARPLGRVADAERIRDDLNALLPKRSTR